MNKATVSGSTAYTTAVTAKTRLATPEAATRQIMANMNGLDEAVSELQQLVNSLADRVTPLLRVSQTWRKAKGK